MIKAPRKRTISRGLAWDDLARTAGVSATTASLALNNHPRVAAATRQRVAEAAARLGFVRNNGARRLARTRTNARATVVDQVGLIYFGAQGAPLDAVLLAMMDGAEHELSKVHASLTFLRVSDEPDWEKVQRLSASGSVDGWLVYGPV
jgi:DNA-binding LacI/PurR family transcriptional regulator